MPSWISSPICLKSLARSARESPALRGWGIVIVVNGESSKEAGTSVDHQLLIVEVGAEAVEIPDEARNDFLRTERGTSGRG